MCRVWSPCTLSPYPHHRRQLRDLPQEHAEDEQGREGEEKTGGGKGC